MFSKYHINRLTLYVIAIFLSPALVCSQTLDSAINEQLGLAFGIECGELLGGVGAAATALTGQLANICTRGFPAAGAGPSSSSGGNAGTPITLSGDINKRLKQAHGDESVISSNPNAIDIGGKNPGFFFSAQFDAMNRAVTSLEDGYKSDIAKIVTGLDTQYDESWFAGVAVKTTIQKGKFIAGQHFESAAYGVTGFGSYLINEQLYIDFYAGYTRKKNKQKRSASFTQLDANGALQFKSTAGDPKISNDSNQFSAGLLFAFDSVIQNVSYGPRISLDWVNTKYDTYSETGATGLELSFHDDQQTSLISTVGYFRSVAVSTSFAVITFQESISWKHEFDQNQRNIEVSFVGDTRQKRFSYLTDVPDRDYIDLNVGASIVLPDDFQFFFNARTLLGNDIIDNYGISLGMRMLL